MTSSIPGMYLFTQAEETGGKGMKQVVLEQRDRFKGYKRAIAFDRKGKHDICGEQSRGNCASKEFVSELAKRLKMKHTWACGTYTDNSELKGIVSEVVNISCGYERNHSPAERLAYNYLSVLADRILEVDWETLPVIGPEPDVDRWSSYRSTVYDDKWWNREKVSPKGHWDYQANKWVWDDAIATHKKSKVIGFKPYRESDLFEDVDKLFGRGSVKETSSKRQRDDEIIVPDHGTAIYSDIAIQIEREVDETAKSICKIFGYGQGDVGDLMDIKDVLYCLLDSVEALETKTK
jgi:hypothetical protein